MNFVELPPELLSTCFSFLNGISLSKVSQTCKLFNEISQDELLWQQRCLKEYGLKTSAGWAGTYREIYGTVLHRFGYLPGLWRNCTTCYGGLVTIKYKEDGRIVAEELYALRDVREKLLNMELFHISLSEERQLQTEWLGSHWGPQNCDIQPSVPGGPWTKTINVEWKEQKGTEKSSQDLEKEKTVFLERSSTRGIHPDLCMYKWLSQNKYQYSQNFTRLEIPLCNDKLPVNLGLYKGTYGGHGTEILLLTYDETNNKLNAMKISGDPNVPAGEVSLCIDLSRPMVLTAQQQQTLAQLKNLDPDETAPDSAAESMNQPFQVPYEIDTRDNFEYPRFCKARYHSLGTVSPMDFKHPTQIDNHFVVFDKDTFGIMWISLYSFAFFSRVQEDLQSLS